MLIVFDQWLFSILNSAAASPLTGGVAVFFAKYALYILFVVLIVFSIRSLSRIRATLLSCTLAYAISQIIGALWFRPRPFVSMATVHKLIEKSSFEKSFPSDHATLAFAAAALIFSFSPRIGYGAYICAALIALARIMVGVHYPSDVIFGALLGVAAVWCIKRLFQRSGDV